MNVAEQIRQEGYQEGRQEAEVEYLLNQIQFKFGTLTSSQKSIVEKANFNQINKWAIKVITAKSLQDFFAEDLANC